MRRSFSRCIRSSRRRCQGVAAEDCRSYLEAYRPVTTFSATELVTMRRVSHAHQTRDPPPDSDESPSQLPRPILRRSRIKHWRELGRSQPESNQVSHSRSLRYDRVTSIANPRDRAARTRTVLATRSVGTSSTDTTHAPQRPPRTALQGRPNLPTRSNPPLIDVALSSGRPHRSEAAS